MKYSEVLSKLIDISGLSLTEIADRSEALGQKITTSYLSKLKNGKMPPPSFKISAVLARVLNSKPEQLLAAGMMENSNNNIKELEEAISLACPEYDYPQIFERARAISIDPKSIIDETVFYQSDMSEEEVEKLIAQAPSYDDYILVDKNAILRVPIIGTIPAGSPALAEEHIEEWTEIPNMWNLKDGEVFILKVKGDSMINSRIYEGDLVVVKIQQDVENGEIAVVNVNGHDATLKRVKKVNGQVILYPDNPKYEPIFIENENARIVGKVIQVMFDPHKKL